MSSYSWIIWFDTAISKNVLWIAVAASGEIEALKAAYDLAGPEIAITGAQRLI